MRTITCSGVALMCLFAATAMADIKTFTASSSGVYYAINGTLSGTSGFFVSPTGLTGTNASATNNGSEFVLSATGSTYSDAGIVLYFNGGLKLGNISTISVNGTNLANVEVNLWLDTNGDGKFFEFNGDELTGLDGDSYAGCPSGGNINSASQCYMLGGVGAGATYTLSQLQSGADPGISGSTPAALWIGLTNSNSSNIYSVTVNTPEAGAVALLIVMLCLVGIGQFLFIRKQRA